MKQFDSLPRLLKLVEVSVVFIQEERSHPVQNRLYKLSVKQRCSLYWQSEWIIANFT